MNASTNQFIFRNIRRDDMLELKMLHEAMFPVHYSNEYYVGATENRGINNGRLHTIIAEDTITKEIAGFLFYQYLSMAECEDLDLFYTEPLEICYILILGLPEKYRRHRLGSRLIDLCINEVRDHPSCGAIYLHVIDYNQAAIRFYQHNGFKCLRKLIQYYTIPQANQTINYDAYIYIYYCHGYQAPLFYSIYNGIRYGAMWIMNIVNFTRYSSYFTSQSMLGNVATTNATHSHTGNKEMIFIPSTSSKLINFEDMNQSDLV